MGMSRADPLISYSCGDGSKTGFADSPSGGSGAMGMSQGITYSSGDGGRHITYSSGDGWRTESI